MKRVILTLTLMMCVAFTLSAQDIKATTLQVGTDKLDAYAVSVTHSPQVAQQQLIAQLKAKGLSIETVSDCLAAVGQKVDALGGTIDLYAVVERKGDEPTTITLAALPSEGNTIDAATLQKNTQQFLADIAKAIYESGESTAEGSATVRIERTQEGRSTEGVENAKASQTVGMRRAKDGRLTRLSSGMKVNGGKNDGGDMKQQQRDRNTEKAATDGVLEMLQ